MPKLFKLVLPMLLVTPVLLSAWYKFNLQPVSKTQAETLFIIPKGQSTKIILRRLEQEKIIRSATVFDYYLFFSGQRKSLQAGSFRLSPSMSVQKIAGELQHGTLDIWVTIPEGWRSEQIVDELQAQELITDQPQDQLYPLFKENEGRLFPDTYLIAKDWSAEQIIDKFTDNFAAKTESLKPQTSDLILASLIEREAKHDNDRPLIASVLKNRLEIGMALQVDSTLQYAKAIKACGTFGTSDTCGTSTSDWWPDVFAEDKKILSPYNTYLHSDLPPGPITNPGLKSIQAALHPSDTNYLYYLSEPDGTTHYAATLEEHNANITKYLR